MMMWIVLGIIAAVASAVAVRHQVHMFQLNSYRHSTHWTWLGLHRGAWVPSVVVAVLEIIALALPGVGPSVIAWIVIVLLVITVVANWPRTKRAKKPLVFTARVVRLLVTITLLVAIITVVACFVPAPLRPPLVCLDFIAVPVWPFVANTINAPVEAAVRGHYLADAKRRLAAQPDLLRIGITGSYGKTSVKYYLTALLKSRYNVLMTPQSYNTPMGITKTIRGELRATHEVFVCEMGAEKVGEIAADCDLVTPTIGIITAIGEQHLVTFGSQDNIVRTKLELAQAVKGKGPVYLNGDNALLRANAPDQERHWYGLGEDNDTYSDQLAVSLAGTTFTVHHRGATYADLVTPLIGAHNIQNLTGAIAVALDLGVTEPQLRLQLKRLSPPPHRLAMSRQGDVIMIDDAYNSNPAGAKAALDTLAMFDATKILITPGMVQLGPRQDALNHQFGVQAAICDHVFLVGDPRQTDPIGRGLAQAGYDPAAMTVIADVKQAIAKALAMPSDRPKVILLENDLPDNY
ncbi:MAG: UDP-N-acetylmuramoyl-tripeptide--D-alanyl-D-alanine ligase [Propionibacteriaceae bacterium]|jgi:UDP-N-acetylmuramoyl-tripeptide--D-alanyl-D-alanine ligase|nr:UDP-N-acetylmuramoyl-tripeptide--D-alanyl-D-alanine ligase [Propionibacteriaceae bacterium]